MTMAPVKRKNDVAAEGARPEKMLKPSTSTQKLSVLREEEPAFPRGGASILTPLEHKRIQIQAKQDVLFEQSTGKKAARSEFEDEENDEDMPDQPNGPIKKTKSKAKPRDKKEKKNGLVKEATVRIEGLSYKVQLPITCEAITKASSSDSYLVHWSLDRSPRSIVTISP